MTNKESWKDLKNWLKKEKEIANKQMINAVGEGFATNRMHRRNNLQEVLSKMDEIEISSN